MKAMISTVALATLLVALTACDPAEPSAEREPETAAGAHAFLERVEKDYAELYVFASQVGWINSTYLTEDTDAVNAKVGADLTEKGVVYAKQAARFADVPDLDPGDARKLNILRSGLTLPAPETPGAAAELNKIATKLQSDYGKGKGLLQGKPIDGSDIEAAMGTNRNPDELKEMWTSWHDNVGVPMRRPYGRMVGIANAGAKELGYVDTGAMWRSKYDMKPDQFAAMMDKLWNDVKPLYTDLHCYVRGKLNEKYGDKVQPEAGPIRADLLGNMWAQEWGNIYDIVAPPGAGNLGYDIGELLLAKRYDPVKMVKAGEGFYTSLGLAALPATFWRRSLIVKPRDREVVCHASAWDIDGKDDVRIKMCTKVNSDDFVTIHHELGHNYYQRAYKAQPFLFQEGANDGFHEAIGDFIALSVTPEYLVQIGLLDRGRVPGPDKDIGLLLRKAMDKIAFLPFGLLVDKWRWGVFGGATPANGYQKGWDDLRLRYQGVVPPVARDESRFDPGAKYHIPGNTPYARYFLAAMLQFQLYEAACRQAGWTGPLHRCSFYNNKEVGTKLNRMLQLGASRPWPEALQTFTGTREINGRAMLAYFQPLGAWLKVQNRGKLCGW